MSPNIPDIVATVVLNSILGGGANVIHDSGTAGEKGHRPDQEPYVSLYPGVCSGYRHADLQWSCRIVLFHRRHISQSDLAGDGVEGLPGNR